MLALKRAGFSLLEGLVCLNLLLLAMVILLGVFLSANRRIHQQRQHDCLARVAQETLLALPWPARSGELEVLSQDGFQFQYRRRVEVLRSQRAFLQLLVTVSESGREVTVYASLREPL